MKKVTFLIIFLLSASVVFSQVNRNKVKRVRGKRAVKVEAAQVPQAVKDAQAKKFPGTSQIRWQMKVVKTKTGPKKDFISLFKHDELRTKAHYKADGTPLLIVHLLPANKVPSGIVSTVNGNYSGFTLKHGRKIEILTKNTVVYRLVLTKPAAKLVLYVDESGNDAKQAKDAQEAIGEGDSDSDMDMDSD
jgi:hypothetical protein